MDSQAVVYCHQCGHANPETANFCARCGERLTQLGEETPLDDPGTGGLRGGSGDTTTSIPVVSDDPDAPELDEDERAAVAALPQGSALLVVQWGPGEGSRFLVDSDTITIGRSPKSDVFLDDITVSRHHATLTRENGQVVVTDPGSLNGTYVNRTLIEGPVTLHPGDVLQTGKFRMVYHPSPRGLS